VPIANNQKKQNWLCQREFNRFATLRLMFPTKLTNYFESFWNFAKYWWPLSQGQKMWSWSQSS